MTVQQGSSHSTASAGRSTMIQRVTAAIDRAAAWTLADQSPDGYWVGSLESNACMEAQWVLAQHILGIDDDTKYDRVVRSILNDQRKDGSWEVYHNAPRGDINTTVECYAALRSAGFPPDDPRLQAAGRWILGHGGLAGIRVFTRYWLAMIGEWPWSQTPTLPPELIYLPTWSPMHLYSFASWARATLVPLCILSARRPVRPLPPDRRLDALFPEGRASFDFRFRVEARPFSWEWTFAKLDRVLSLYARSPWQPGRETAIRLCLEWVLRHQDADGAWGGIQPPWIYSLLALKTEGYALSHPAIEQGLAAFDDHWSYEHKGGLRLQASDSIVWDTLLMLLALYDCGRTPSEEPALQRAVDWILGQQVFAPGDWQYTVRGVEPGGWAFERANLAYPDCDDTAVAILALEKLKPHVSEAGRVEEAIERAEKWLRAMQSKSGGWAAFDRDNTNRLVCKIPFADFGEMLDPPSADVTAHVLEALAARGGTADDPCLARGLGYLLSEQEPDGSWFGRWGVNYVYGTGAALPALRAIGLPADDTRWKKAAQWLLEHQNDDGGWGETPASYMDDSLRGRGESTASQTAWALLALMAIETHQHDAAIRRGVDFLIDRQRHDGTWDEPHFTGTGFPGYGAGERRIRSRRTGRAASLDQGVELQRGFMINYNLYRHYFPMMALGRARRHLARHVDH